MCADHRSRVELAAIVDAFSHLKIPLRFPSGLPNIPPRDSIRITDPATVIRTAPDDTKAAELLMMRWSWPGPSGKPVFNFRSEGRAFGSGRCLIVADGFYEFTDAPASEGASPKRARKQKWLFTKAGEPWFCIAALWRPSPAGDAFAMLTTAPGPDVAPFHDRQIVVLDRGDCARWLDPAVPAGELLVPAPPGTLIAERI